MVDRWFFSALVKPATAELLVAISGKTFSKEWSVNSPPMTPLNPS